MDIFFNYYIESYCLKLKSYLINNNKFNIDFNISKKYIPFLEIKKPVRHYDKQVLNLILKFRLISKGMKDKVDKLLSLFININQLNTKQLISTLNIEGKRILNQTNQTNFVKYTIFTSISITIDCSFPPPTLFEIGRDLVNYYLISLSNHNSQINNEQNVNELITKLIEEEVLQHDYCVIELRHIEQTELCSILKMFFRKIQSDILHDLENYFPKISIDTFILNLLNNLIHNSENNKKGLLTMKKSENSLIFHYYIMYKIENDSWNMIEFESSRKYDVIIITNNFNYLILIILIIYYYL